MSKGPVTHIVVDELKGMVRRGYADIPEGQMHYRYQGSGGKTLLLLHMVMSSSDEYTRMIPLLSGKFRVLAPDHLGQGMSDLPPRQYEIADYARAIISFMDSLNIKKANISGQHGGAHIAVEIAATRPERVESLILSAIPCPKDPQVELAKLSLPEMQGIEVKWDGSHLIEYWERANRFGESVQVCNERALDYFMGGPRGEEMHWASFRYAVQVHDRLKQIKCPTLLICGSKDWLRPGSEVAQQLLPGSKLILIEGGATIMNREMPKEVVAAILPFLESL
jgi:pimeloyl-ACP methyl ester carboxylesterase